MASIDQKRAFALLKEMLKFDNDMGLEKHVTLWEINFLDDLKQMDADLLTPNRCAAIQKIHDKLVENGTL